MDAPSADPPPCPLCGSSNTRLLRSGNFDGRLDPARLRITDAAYGVTADLHGCERCGFRFCPTLRGVTAQYAQMDDPGYEATRAERALQARDLLRIAARHRSGGKLLDIGAGSGILVEQAHDFGFVAQGIEPSRPLSQIAQDLGLAVTCGVLPQPGLARTFDVVTLIDVIEHVEDPAGLLRQAADCLVEGGICILVTPDVDALAAHLMGRRWWHYRLAHIGYFNRRTLALLAKTCGLRIVETRRPGWHFPASYLFRRILGYFPAWMRFAPPAWMDGIRIPLNLRDSMLAVCRKES